MEKSAMLGTKRRTAFILSDDVARHGQLENLAGAACCDIIVGGDGVLPDGMDFVLADFRTISEPLTQTISRLARYLANQRGAALIWTDSERMEDAYLQLPIGRAHLLVDSDDSQAVPILAGALGQESMNRVSDKGRLTEFGALHRISDELAEFARTLARIAEQDARDGSSLNDKPISFRPAPSGTFHSFPKTDVNEDLPIDPHMIRELIKLRRLRDSYFASDLFADPAWDILLDLMASQLERRRVSVSSLCIAAAVPPTTALRWITAMTESGMLIRNNDPDDARRVFIGLSTETEASLRKYLSDIQSRSSPMV